MHDKQAVLRVLQERSPLERGKPYLKKGTYMNYGDFWDRYFEQLLYSLCKLQVLADPLAP